MGRIAFPRDPAMQNKSRGKYKNSHLHRCILQQSSEQNRKGHMQAWASLLFSGVLGSSTYIHHTYVG